MRPSRTAGAIAFLALLAGASLAAQASPGNSPRFDVVSIRISNYKTRGGAWDDRCDSGRWTARNVPVSILITTAFNVEQSQVVGIPDWDNHPLHQFVITATCPPGTLDHQTQPMLQAMLRDRFGLVSHWETRPMKVRTLEIAPGGSKLKPATGNCVEAPPSAPPLPEGQHRCGEFVQVDTGTRRDGQPFNDHYKAWSATTADFVAYFGWFGRLVQPPLVDETGLTGKYDFDFQYEVITNLKDASGKPVNQQYKAIQAMRDQLGLIFNQDKLTKKPMPFLVIDHVAMPTPN